MIKFTTKELDWIYAAISPDLDELVMEDFARNAEVIALHHALMAKIAHAYVIADKEEDS